MKDISLKIQPLCNLRLNLKAARVNELSLRASISSWVNQRHFNEDDDNNSEAPLIPITIIQVHLAKPSFVSLSVTLLWKLN
ncbi:hypothetical protein L3X38_008872 [Prunus dulcis]|uniref:Uncharacterized protein n=1 Tax=Prunus dulcis TaxID=3755 RepID=A0AAD4ZXC3_PRUDU|nr:hypothetical protein L3X38_008872 [Prunus dulcis]